MFSVPSAPRETRALFARKRPATKLIVLTFGRLTIAGPGYNVAKPLDCGLITVRFTASAVALEGIPHKPTIAIVRAVFAATAPPPRVSTARHGVIKKNFAAGAPPTTVTVAVTLSTVPHALLTRTQKLVVCCGEAVTEDALPAGVEVFPAAPMYHW